MLYQQCPACELQHIPERTTCKRCGVQLRAYTEAAKALPDSLVSAAPGVPARMKRSVYHVLGFVIDAAVAGAT